MCTICFNLEHQEESFMRSAHNRIAGHFLIILSTALTSVLTNKELVLTSYPFIKRQRFLLFHSLPLSIMIFGKLQQNCSKNATLGAKPKSPLWPLQRGTFGVTIYVFLLPMSYVVLTVFMFMFVHYLFAHRVKNLIIPKQYSTRRQPFSNS